MASEPVVEWNIANVPTSLSREGNVVVKAKWGEYYDLRLIYIQLSREPLQAHFHQQPWTHLQRIVLDGDLIYGCGSTHRMARSIECLNPILKHQWCRLINWFFSTLTMRMIWWIWQMIWTFPTHSRYPIFCVWQFVVGSYFSHCFCILLPPNFSSYSSLS